MLYAGKTFALKGPVVTILSGRNIDMQLYDDIMQGKDERVGEYFVKGSPYGSSADENPFSTKNTGK